MAQPRRRAGKVTVSQTTPAGAEALFTLTMQLERETPGAVRYQELGDGGEPVKQADAHIGTLYIRKDKLEGNIPQMIHVAIAVAPAPVAADEPDAE